MQLKVIYDAPIYPDQVNLSQNFKGGQFLIFDIPGTPEDEVTVIGLALNARLPLIGSTIIKNWSDISEASTDSLIVLPREYSESNYDFYCAFASTIFLPLFRVYVVTSEASIEGLNTSLEEIKALIQQSEVEIPQEIIDRVLPVLLDAVVGAITGIPLPASKLLPLLQ